MTLVGRINFADAIELGKRGWVKERTCKDVLDKFGGKVGKCSECGQFFAKKANYCPSCGAKVIK